jgi:hypothetical protein
VEATGRQWNFFGRPGKLGGGNTEAIVTSKMSNLVMTRGEVAILEGEVAILE